MSAHPQGWRRGWLPPAALLLAGVALWEALVQITQTPRWFLPAPSAVAAALGENWRLLARHTLVTAEETLLGFALACLLGVAVATAIAFSRLVERTIYPLVVASQAVPIIAVAPLLLVWFGYDLTPKVIVVVLFCFFPITVNTVDGLRAADRAAVDLLRSMGAGPGQVWRLVRLPSALPYLISGARVAAAVSVVGALVGEWVGSAAGLGYFMIRSASQFLTDRVFAAVVLSALLGLVLFGAVSLLERLLLPWQRLERRERT
ncbi:MAG: ABC transporter permease [Sphaerobacter sp.]|nr:ABC transporter permease [Sphaerobacter sp.]